MGLNDADGDHTRLQSLRSEAQTPDPTLRGKVGR